MVLDAAVGQGTTLICSPQSLLPDALPLDTHCFLDVGPNIINKDSKDDTRSKMDVWHHTFMLSAPAYMVRPQFTISHTHPLIVYMLDPTQTRSSTWSCPHRNRNAQKDSATSTPAGRQQEVCVPCSGK